VRGVRFAARAGRLTTPVGAGLTAVAFAPEIARGVRVAGRFVGRAVSRGTAFFAGRTAVQAAVGSGAAGVVAGGLASRKSGRVERPSERGALGIVKRKTTPASRAKARRTVKKKKKEVKRGRKRKAPTDRVRRKRKVVRRRKKRTHRSPRHKGHTRVSFTTKSGQKVKFLARKVPPKHPHR